MRLNLKRVRVRGAVVGMALTLGGGVLLAATPAMAASTSGPCNGPGVAGIAVAHAHGAPIECVLPNGTQVTSPGGGAEPIFLKID